MKNRIIKYAAIAVIAGAGLACVQRNGGSATNEAVTDFSVSDSSQVKEVAFTV